MVAKNRSAERAREKGLGTRIMVQRHVPSDLLLPPRPQLIAVHLANKLINGLSHRSCWCPCCPTTALSPTSERYYIGDQALST